MRKSKFLDCGISFNLGILEKRQLIDIGIFMVFLIGYWKTLLDFYRIGFGLILKPINQLLKQRWDK